MKKSGSTIGWFCAVCLLLIFADNESIAAPDAVPAGKPAQASSESKKMGFVELVQKLEAADPWSVEKVSEALGGISLPLTYSNEYILSYTANNFIYENELLVKKVELRLSIRKNKMARLILYLNENTKCITQNNLKKMYPDLYSSPYNSEDTFYLETKRSWGLISFGFKEGRFDCLGSIVFIPKGEE
ncbi:MAG: hypothetical protein LBP99_05335 [Azoarcus sp.]|jgi:hypothetical protein|nr:hypothetical protein [Azoarcus sp.]